MICVVILKIINVTCGVKIGSPRKVYLHTVWMGIFTLSIMVIQLFSKGTSLPCHVT